MLVAVIAFRASFLRVFLLATDAFHPACRHIQMMSLHLEAETLVYSIGCFVVQRVEARMYGWGACGCEFGWHMVSFCQKIKNHFVKTFRLHLRCRELSKSKDHDF